MDISRITKYERLILGLITWNRKFNDGKNRYVAIVFALFIEILFSFNIIEEYNTLDG